MCCLYTSLRFAELLRPNFKYNLFHSTIAHWMNVPQLCRVSISVGGLGTEVTQAAVADSFTLIHLVLLVGPRPGAPQGVIKVPSCVPAGGFPTSSLRIGSSLGRYGRVCLIHY